MVGAHCDIGAYEFDANLIFKDGFSIIRTAVLITTRERPQFCE